MERAMSDLLTVSHKSDPRRFSETLGSLALLHGVWVKLPAIKFVPDM